VGGPNSNIHVEGLVDDHFWLRITRGRVMIEPGQGAVFLEGQRLRTITPLYADEEFQAGLIRFRVDRTIFEESPKASGFGDMVGESEKITLLFGILRRIATHNFPCLIIGESGTGKELIARGIHSHSHRADGPFVALNCGAIGESIFESELFGHEKGAFTGASRQKDGAFHEADGGTLFLDEIGELPPALQTKLLRTLETGEVRRVGSTQTTHPDVRILSATNRDLTTEVREGRFREDLFFRLAVLTAMVPPLRDRLDDLEGLIRHICHALHPETHISDNAMEVLRSHAWPGNVRELKNVLTRAYVMHGTRIDADNLVFHQIGHAPETERPTKGSLKDAERHYLNTTLARHNGNRSAAAKELGIARSTLHYKLRKFGLI